MSDYAKTRDEISKVKEDVIILLDALDNNDEDRLDRLFEYANRVVASAQLARAAVREHIKEESR